LSVQTLAHAYPSASISFAFMQPCTKPSQQAVTLAYLGTMQLTLPQQSYGWHILCRCRAYMQHWLHCIHGVWKNHCDHLATRTNAFWRKVCVPKLKQWDQHLREWCLNGLTYAAHLVTPGNHVQYESHLQCHTIFTHLQTHTTHQPCHLHLVASLKAFSAHWLRGHYSGHGKALSLSWMPSKLWCICGVALFFQWAIAQH
jgi:hypothetical protein